MLRANHKKPKSHPLSKLLRSTNQQHTSLKVSPTVISTSSHPSSPPNPPPSSSLHNQRHGSRRLSNSSPFHLPPPPPLPVLTMAESYPHSPTETSTEYYNDITLCLAFSLTALIGKLIITSIDSMRLSRRRSKTLTHILLIAFRRMHWSYSQGGVETTVVTAFYSLILLTSTARAGNITRRRRRHLRCIACFSTTNTLACARCTNLSSLVRYSQWMA